MDRPAPGLRLEAIIPPRQDIMRIWRTLRPVDHAFIQGIIGDMAHAPDPRHLRAHPVRNYSESALQSPRHTHPRNPPRTPSRMGPRHQDHMALRLDAPPRVDTFDGILSARRVSRIPALVFGTLPFPCSPNLIDGAIAQVVLQAVGSHSYVEALLAETVRSLDYVREVRRGRIRGSPHLLQIWLLAHVRPFCSSHPFSYITDERSLIKRLVPVIPHPEHSFSEWRHFWRELTPARFLWVARWNPGGPMITGCPGIVGVPLLSHLGSTLIFPGRVIRQLGDLQDIPTEADRQPYRIQWADSTSTAPVFATGVAPLPDSSASQDGGRGSSRYLRRSQPTGSGSFPTTPDARSDASDSCRHAPGVFRRPSDASPAPDVFRELLALLRGPNRASLSSTPPPGQGPTVDPTPWVSPTQAPKNMDAPAPPTLHTSTAHPFTSPFPPPPAPTAVPLPSTAFLTSDQVLSAPPPVSMPAPTAIYAAPPPTVFSASSVPAPNHPQAAELPSYPPPQPHTSFPYQAPPPINTTFHEPGTPTHAAQFAPPTHFFEFVIHSFQDSLSGSALDWFMSLRTEDIPTWEDLSRKFIDQYRYCAEASPTLLELSTKEMAQGQRFEEYATKWRAQAAKHIPPISEAQQIQLFHSTLRGVYYSHLLAHTSSFSDLIEAGKKLDLGIKLGRMEGPASKGEESSKKVPATSSSSGERRGKEVSVNAVNTAHQASQQYSMNFTQYPALPVPLSHIYRQIRDKIGTIAPGPSIDPTIQDQSKQCEYHRGALGHTLDTCWRLRERIQEMIDAKELVFNAVRSPNVQANPLPDHGPSQGSSINMITIYTSGEGKSEQGCPSPFVIEYVPQKM
ncbi:hypothetical protein CRG98_019616 [Punica granatum]|uniref:Uncharacterized protein n=1 Tax=Punica granatum TaxID=22663 RepID=A0A2I0JUK1_PUNGR|nr:hypothetical protein CRG98_019616 [Punica granatum]